VVSVADGASAMIQLILCFFARAYIRTGLGAIANEFVFTCIGCIGIFYIREHRVDKISYSVDVRLTANHSSYVPDQTFPKTIVVF
jgi:hypothetical protein